VRPEKIATGRAYSSSNFSAAFAISCARLRCPRSVISLRQIMTAPSQTAKALAFANVER
jgi:hypothetical protein